MLYTSPTPSFVKKHGCYGQLHTINDHQMQGVTNCCQISYTLPEILFEIFEIIEILKSEIKESWNSDQ